MTNPLAIRCIAVCRFSRPIICPGKTGAEAGANDSAGESQRPSGSHGRGSGTKVLFVAAVANNTLEVVDLTAGKVIKSLSGFKDMQDALFLAAVKQIGESVTAVQGDISNLHDLALFVAWRTLSRFAFRD
jgi:hypothetical protein